MSKSPAVLFYTSDFLTGTVLFSDAQVGKYMRLLCLQHQKGHLTDKDMKKVCRGYDEDIYSKFVQDENGLYYNERMEGEILKRTNFREAQRANIMKRWNKNGINHGNTTVLPLENENNNKDNINSLDERGECEGREKEKGKKDILKQDMFENRTFSANMKAALEKWLQYKKERRESYKPTGLTGFINKAESSVNEYGESEVIRVIDESIASGYVGVTWQKMKNKNANNFSDSRPKEKTAPGTYSRVI